MLKYLCSNLAKPTLGLALAWALNWMFLDTDSVSHSMFAFFNYLVVEPPALLRLGLLYSDRRPMRKLEVHLLRTGL
jgi:hypothetical protein